VKLHLDTDIGGDLDNLCALAFLLSWPDVEITGVTTVLEDGGKRAGYARYVLNLAGRSDVQVAAGSEASLPCFRARYGLPPEERYWPEPIVAAPGPLDAALDLLEQSVEQGATILRIGPYTNLSLLERRRPGILAQATLCLMGGSIQPIPAGFPEWDFTFDFNVQANVGAARHVLESASPDQTTLVPLEATVQTALRRADLPTLREASPLGELIAHQAEAFVQDQRYDEQYGRICAGLPDDIVNFQHDPLACAVAVGWDGVTVETLPLVPVEEDGWLRMRIDPRGRPLHVVTTVEPIQFNAHWLRTVANW